MLIIGNSDDFICRMHSGIEEDAKGTRKGKLVGYYDR